MIMLICQHLIESSVFACAIAIIALFMRNASAAARYVLWFCAVAKFALPLVLLARLGVIFQSLFPVKFFALASSANLSGTHYLPPNASNVSSGDGLPHWLLLLIAVAWLSGSTIIFALWIRQSIRFRQPLEIPAEAECGVLDPLRQRLGIQRVIGLRYSPSNRNEVGLWGFFHPTVRIPKGLSTQLTPAEFEAVLLHELAHVRRQDNLCAAFAHCIVCAFWFYPLLWWIEQRLSIERERACDEMVIHHGTAAGTYISGILKVCRFQMNDMVAGMSAMTRSDLTKRTELIMSYPLQHPVSWLPKLLLGWLGALITIVPLSIGFLHSELNAQTVAANRQGTLTAKQVACVFNGVNYQPGTVLRMGEAAGSPARECSSGKWIASRKSATLVSKAKLHDPCEAEPSTSSNACRCQDGDYSLGAIVQSANSTAIRCDRFELGQFTTWRPATPRERGEK